MNRRFRSHSKIGVVGFLSFFLSFFFFFFFFLREDREACLGNRFDRFFLWKGWNAWNFMAQFFSTRAFFVYRMIDLTILLFYQSYNKKE